MEIIYSNSVRSKMKDKRSLVRNYGALSDRIWGSLSLLMVASNLADVPNVPPTRRHKLTAREGCWALDLSPNWRMIIRALSGNEPENITKVEIISVEDYH